MNKQILTFRQRFAQINGVAPSIVTSDELGTILEADAGANNLRRAFNPKHPAGETGEFLPGNVDTRNTRIYKALRRDANYYHSGKKAYATSDQLHNALDTGDWAVKMIAVRHPHATPEHINKGLDSNDYQVALNAANHPNASQENLRKAFNHSDPAVRMNALNNPNATEQLYRMGLKDSHKGVRYVAAAHLRSNSKDTK
jgi:hypothetical protein